MFRVYDKKRKIFVDEDVLINKNGDLYTVGKSLLGNKLTFLHQNRYVFQKEIGLKDKNNVEIYVGDYLEAQVADDRIVRGLVTFAEELSAYIILCFDADEYFTLGTEVCQYIEVVGNVFDEFFDGKKGKRDDK